MPALDSPEVFKGQRVVVVGLSNTAADIAVDLSEVADKTYVSHRSGAFIVRTIYHSNYASIPEYTINQASIDHALIQWTASRSPDYSTHRILRIGLQFCLSNTGR